jgi:hypothetical protein
MGPFIHFLTHSFISQIFIENKHWIRLQVCFRVPVSRSSQCSGGNRHNQIIKTECDKHSGRGVDTAYTGRKMRKRDNLQEPGAGQSLREELTFELGFDRQMGLCQMKKGKVVRACAKQCV